MFRATATGRLTRDPELITGENHDPLCKIAIATDRYVGKSDDGGSNTVTDYLDIIVWGPIALTHHEQLGKGHLIVATGDLVQDRWENADGEKRSTLVLKADQIQYLARPRTKSDTPKEDATA